MSFQWFIIVVIFTVIFVNVFMHPRTAVVLFYVFYLCTFCVKKITGCCCAICWQSNQEHRGTPPSPFDKVHWVILRALHNTRDQRLYVPSEGRRLGLEPTQWAKYSAKCLSCYNGLLFATQWVAFIVHKLSNMLLCKIAGRNRSLPHSAEHKHRSLNSVLLNHSATTLPHNDSYWNNIACVLF